MLTALANPQRFMAFSRIAAPVCAVAAGLLILSGLWFGFAAPEDYQQGETVRIMFVHVPAAWIGMGAYVALGASSFFGLVFRHALAHAAARACAPLGAGFTALALVTGSLWGRPMWGTWWVWDARLTSMLVLFLFYLGYMALQASIDDEAKGARAAAILALVGLVNLPIVHFSVTWWSGLHQQNKIETVPAMLWPLGVMIFAYLALSLWLFLVRLDGEILDRKYRALRARITLN